jgi:hypothetical protein
MRQGGSEMKMTIGTITKIDPDKLQKLFDLIDDIGISHEYSRADGELAIYAGDVGILLEADKSLIEDAYADEYWQRDAEKIAEGYWNQ